MFFLAELICLLLKIVILKGTSNNSLSVTPAQAGVQEF
jgi:hypothetical protein